MLRTLATFILGATVSMLSAQDMSATTSPDTPEMLATAQERTDLVDKTVKLSPDQKKEVHDVYIQVERYMAALKKRFEGQPKEVVEGDMPGQYANMDRYTQDRLNTILTPEQLAKWKEASK